MTDRTVDAVIIHCTYTPPTMDIGVKEIDQWHRERGWDGCGYHRVIRRDGSVEQGRPLDAMGAHVLGHNETSIGLALVGGMRKINEDIQVPDCNFTKSQWISLECEIVWLEHVYGEIKIFGHRDFDDQKECPCFDVREWRYGG